MTKTMTAKFGGTCRRCSKPFPAGTAIVWTKGGGAEHASALQCQGGAATAPASSTAQAPMFAKFAGRCTRCGGHFPAGTAIQWTKGAGATHADAQACATVAASAPAPVSLSLAGIVAFLNAAKDRGLKFPKARFLAPTGAELRLSIAGATSKAPGSINVVVANEWLGRVEPTGVVAGRQLLADAALLDTLRAIEADPAAAAKAYGALMCRCSFCGLTLTDEGSVEVGYGPVCADKWGLPHTPKGTPAVQAVA